VKVSVVVITARADPGFKELANSLLKSSHKDFELILVDRLLKERTESWSEACKAAGIDFTHVQDDSPQGPCPSAARNLGITAASGDYIICIDDLTSFSANLIDEHVTVARDYGFDAICGSYVERIAESDKIDPRTLDPYQNHGKWISQRFYGMHMGFTKYAWETVGGFDESFDGAYGFEDCDFGRRLFRAGLAIGWFPSLSVVCYKDSRHDLEHLNVNRGYKGVGVERSFTDEPLANVYGSFKWKNDKLILLNDKIGKIGSGNK
jgi:glycosyltransferase involved in cell wall biosynthesis